MSRGPRPIETVKKSRSGPSSRCTSSRIGDLESGTLALPTGKTDGFRGYVPILVLLHLFPQHPATLVAVRDEVARRGLFQESPGGPGILPPQLVSADDHELVEPVLAAGGDGLRTIWPAGTSCQLPGATTSAATCRCGSARSRPTWPYGAWRRS